MTFGLLFMSFVKRRVTTILHLKVYQWQPFKIVIDEEKFDENMATHGITLAMRGRKVFYYSKHERR